MGCLGAVLAALLALAIPASIAHTSLIGAYVVIAVFAVAGAALVVWRARHKAEPEAARFGIVALLTVAYAVVVTLIHFAT